jgi:hypothetical protein
MIEQQTHLTGCGSFFDSFKMLTSCSSQQGEGRRGKEIGLAQYSPFSIEVHRAITHYSGVLSTQIASWRNETHHHQEPQVSTAQILTHIHLGSTTVYPTPFIQKILDRDIA